MMRNVTAASTTILAPRQVRWQDFPGFMQRVRRQRGLSQQRLSELLGCDRTCICKLEHAQNRPSAVFLHNFLQTGRTDILTLTTEEIETLTAFTLLRMQP